MSDNHKYTFKLEIITGLVLIQKEVLADYYNMEDGVFKFHKIIDDWTDDKLIAVYPVTNTIITSITDNDTSESYSE